MQNHTILASRLSMDSDIPLYTQLVGIIKQNISSGELNVGDLLPSEAELCRTMGISRNTVRQAIGELEEEGLVVRKRGKGTFVADPNARGKCVRYSFTTEISSMGKVPSSTMVDFGIIVPPPEISRKMQLQEGVTVYCFTRVRNVDGEPLILETSYYPIAYTASCTTWALLPPRRRIPMRQWCWTRYGPTCSMCPRAAAHFITSAAPGRRMAAFMSIPAAISGPIE